jgi:hypothetical protein
VVNYAVVGKLMRASGQSMGRWMQPHHVTRFFFASDMLCLFIQGAGGAQMSSADPNAAKLGQTTILAGLALQLGFFAAFTWVAARMRASAVFQLHRVRNIGLVYRVLYATIGLLFIRNFYRVVDFAQSDDADAYIPRSEWMFYVFETLPILLVMLTYTVWHFGRILPDDAELEACMKAPADAAPACELPHAAWALL